LDAKSGAGVCCTASQRGFGGSGKGNNKLQDAGGDFSLEDEAMKTFSRVCIKDYTVTALNGDTEEVKRGREYLTSDVQEGGRVVVFQGKFWASFPVELFAGEVKFT
jgi:hypothetical protein